MAARPPKASPASAVATAAAAAPATTPATAAVPAAATASVSTSATMIVPVAAAPATTETMDATEFINAKWKAAQKLRNTIHKELEKIYRLSLTADEPMANFEAVEELMKKFRLFCLEIIMADIRAANQKGVEDALWQIHCLVTKAYRKVTGSLQGLGLAVLKRKVEKLYVAYITTSQSFYRTYLQRFCGSYKMKELERVARLVKFEQPAVNQVPVNAADPEVEALITISFHKTLIYLGDLSRYRTLVRSRDRSFNSALTYYALANEIIPESGYGYHQSGVIYAEAHNHLEIVYHMLRAIACDQPHPLAATNLEREFRDLRELKAGGARGSQEAMVSWFVKLHAFYFNGQEFTERKELEDEVDHRFAMALKAGGESNIDMVLLKMILINITAYVVGMDKIRVEWTDAKSRSCQFTLLVNIRTIHTVSRLLQQEIQDLVQQKSSTAVARAAVTSTQGETQSKFTSPFHRALPLLRVYMTWLLFYSSDLVAFQPHLEPQFGAMGRSIAKTLTLLLELLSDSADFGTTVTWLFPEDEETSGIKCLNGPDLYSGCQLRFDALKQELKSRPEDLNAKDLTADNAAYTRAFDVALCAIRLAQNSPFPLTMPNGSKTFVYMENGKPSQEHPGIITTKQPVSVDPDLATSKPTAVTVEAPIAPCVPVVPNIPVSAETRAASESEDFSDDREFYEPGWEKVRTAVSGPATGGVTQESQLDPPSDFPLDNQLLDMVNPFLAPPSPDRVDPSHVDTSYGMGSVTAGDVFGPAASTSPAPGSATSKVIPTLPWEFFYPAEHTGTGPRNTATIRSAASGWGSRPGSSGNKGNNVIGNSIGIRGLEKLDDPFSSRSESLTKSSRLGASTMTHSAAFPTTQDWTSQAGLDSKARGNQQLQADNIRGMWPEAGINTSHNSTWGTGPWQQQAPLPVANDRPALNPPFPSSMAFSGVGSSLPLVNSPWGLPTHAPGPMFQGQSQGSGTGFTGTGFSSSGIPQPGIRPLAQIPIYPTPQAVYSPGGGLNHATQPQAGISFPLGLARGNLNSHAFGPNPAATGQKYTQSATELEAAAAWEEHDAKQVRMNAWLDGYEPYPVTVASLAKQGLVENQAPANTESAIRKAPFMVGYISRNDGRPKFQDA
ncbi:hypothetical protein B0T25DRAFT_566915 [Lasiosphaeria hispida]|uniref:Nonsense-mediated mRNA decay factor n=1 Tax=Lasiosphaeria hispida TaxID=260671 RepID=A0AAJ0HMU4_9PEZI|nr:hypothetical protein B0T25DRAFT_566915 [Lasiosphaeria hispida]